MQPPSELIVLAVIADEARLVLNRLHRPDERRQVGDEILRDIAPANFEEIGTSRQVKLFASENTKLDLSDLWPFPPLTSFDFSGLTSVKVFGIVFTATTVQLCSARNAV